MIDVGEIQGALATWGTLHPSGYPLYTIIGNMMVELSQLLGQTPATGASIFSLISSLGVLSIVYWLGYEITRQPILALAVTLLLFASPVYWLNSVIAEVYTFHLLLSLLGVAMAWTIRQRQAAHLLPWLALCAGTAVSHHRTAVLFLPALFYLVWPVLRQASFRRIAAMLILFLLPFVFYIYLPLRGQAEAVWLYGHPNNWSDFWYIFFSQEYRAFAQTPTTWLQISQQLQQTIAVINQNLPLFGLFGLVALLVALKAKTTRPLVIALLLIGTTFISFSLFYAVPDEAVILMPLLFVSLFGLLLFLRQLPESWQPGLAIVLAGVMVLTIGFAIPARRNEILELSRNPAGRELITAVTRLEASQPDIISRWGTEWFAYRYARYATQELPGAAILPPHTNPHSLWQNGQRVFVSKEFFYQESLPDWQAKYGPIYLRSASDGMMELLSSPDTKAPDRMIKLAAPIGAAFNLLGYQWQPSKAGEVALALYWQAVAPSPENYSVFVHLVAQVPPRGPEDILAQADSQHPVFGWYPTGQWIPGEIVRDDYRLAIPPGTSPQAIMVGLYRQNPETGAFENLGEASIPLP